MKLEMLRENIDRIDQQILKLLNDRMEQAVMTRKFKKNTEDDEREKIVLKKIYDNSHGLLKGDFTDRIYKIIIEESKKLQNIPCTVIGFQGEHGAYSEEAAKKWDNSGVTVPCLEFEDVFEGVEAGLYDYGLVPVENNLGGIVGEVNSLLLKKDLKVIAAVEMAVSHCLMILPGSDYREVRNAFSHNQALSQCRDFLSRNKLEPAPYYDTAGAARMISRKQLKGSAAIASRLAANLYGLEIIKENIQDRDDNKTRFFIISKVDDRKTKGSKCSIVFSTEHKTGSLFKTLNIFAEAGINLTRIESVPSAPGEFAFFLDFQIKEDDPAVKVLFDKLKEATTGFKVLGFYNEKTI